MNNLFDEENQERLNELRKRSKPMFHEWARGCHPFWSKAKVEKEAEWFANAYQECIQSLKEASESNDVYKENADDVLVLFTPVVYLPFINTFYFWCGTFLRDRVLTISDLDVSASDTLDSDELFAFLKTLNSDFRVAGYKNIGLHSVLQKRIEKAISDDNLSLFEDILYTHTSETDIMCRYFGRMSKRVMSPDDLMDLVKDQKKAFSLDYFKKTREFLRSIRHLPEGQKRAQIAAFAYASMEDVIWKYMEVKEMMTPGEVAIFEKILYNPIFPIFNEECRQWENDWMEKNHGEYTGQALEEENKQQDAKNLVLEPIEDNPSEEELNSSSPLVLPSDFFSNDSYIDENIHTIGNLPDWVRNAPASQFAQMINYLAGEDHGYIAPSLGNRRLLASILSGRKLKTNRSQVQWIEIMDREQSKTEKVILWLCQFLYGGRYAEAYKVFGRERTILAGSETAYIKYADRTLQERIEVLYPQRTPHRLKTQKEPK